MPADAKTELDTMPKRHPQTCALTDLCFAQTYPFFD